MKFQPDRIDTVAIQAHGPGWVVIAGRRYAHSVIVSAAGVQPWDCASLSELTPAHFAQLVDATPEVVLFGSGRRLRFVAPELLRALLERGIGVETMDTMAAARTYNVLAGEGRRVLAALLIDEPAAP